jgi:NADPH-dependent glutamate synthase beta subunit-like oxidoreductase/NAD-dependent dihydropyrimidine dehydrogenase PreA subunit
MKRTKDRLHRVAVIGATPAGVAATNKLGELGIPVALIDSDADLDLKLSREEWRLKSGMPLNHAHRPGLIRILRNPNIRCLLPARVTEIKHSSQGFRLRLSRLQTFVDPYKCTLCGRCAEICPVSDFETEKAIRINSQRSLPGRPVIDKRRRPLCQENCPLGVNVQGYVTLAKAGRFAEALEIIRENNILPGICGRICTHPCEAACRRGDLDDPIAIRDIKRFIADHERPHLLNIKIPDVLKRPQKIAVIGSGPAGLAAGADLARCGYSVTVFEKEKTAGGLLRYGIGPHRLPREILDLELGHIEKMGVRFITDHPVDLEHDIDGLKSKFDAVIISTGTWCDRKLGVPGENLAGVEGCLAYLSRLYGSNVDALEEKVAVIGDGNAAFDMARTLARQGAAVTIVSWFPEDLIPADPAEIQATREEGIAIIDATQTIAFLETNGKLDRLRCMPTKPGEPDDQGIPWPVVISDSEPFELQFERAFVAIGQAGALKAGQGTYPFDVSRQGLIEVDESGRTNLTGVYAVGDAVLGPSSVVEAMAVARDVARAVHYDICGEHDQRPVVRRPAARDYPEIPTEIPSLARSTMPERQPAARKKNFSEVALGLTEAQVISEAGRCLQCGVCSDCLQCVDACGPINAVNHAETEKETIELTGVVIIADPKLSPQIKGKDVIRAYAPKSAKPDVDAMFIRGFAAAAEAMVLLEGTSQWLKGHGLSFSPPVPGLSPEIRLGVFVCKCNDAKGWLDDMNQYVAGLMSQADVFHAEVVASACVPEGSSEILRTIREKGITRVVLASCVCCPLNFICSSCTDQRSRLKNALFAGAGISRSMVETCNLKGEALPLIKQDQSLAMRKFVGLIDRSVRRARKLKPLPDPVRNYYFNTAVIGISEAAVSSVITLGEAGLEVFWFPNSGRLPAGIPRRSNIHCFEDSLVQKLSGTLGNFKVSAESNNSRQTFPVGAIILDEKSRKEIQFVHQEGLPSRVVTSFIQKKGVPGIPFFYPGSTFISGLFLADPPGVYVSNRKKGAAVAARAAAIMPRGPRQNKGYTAEVDEQLCRSCGRCIRVCPSRAVTLHPNGNGGWAAWVDEALCKGCGNCISVCPSNAADSPFRDQAFLEQMIEDILRTH